MSKKGSLQEQAYQFIRQSIVNGNYQPGEKLRESKVAEQLGISRTPIREALRKLEREGLVTYTPSVGAQVQGLKKESIIELYECRAALEALAAKKAAQTITLEQLGFLEENMMLASQFYQRGDLGKTVEKNSLFHDTILQASESPLLIQLMDQIKVQIVRFRQMTSVYGFRPSFVEEHEAIYQALLKRDCEKAEVLMKAHVEKDLVTILERLRDNQLL